MNRDEHLTSAQWQALIQSKRRKYKNVPTTIGALRFDSRKEARRAQVLLSLQAAGVITDLELDKRKLRYPLIVNGIKVGVYVADSRYVQESILIIEDVKSDVTRKLSAYIMKKKLMYALYQLHIREV